MSYANITVCGYVGRDPEIRVTGTGTKIANFSVAVTERWKKGDEKHERTHWYNVDCFQSGDTGLVSVAQMFVHKGTLLLVSGFPVIEEWEKDGEKRRSFKIRLSGPNCTLRLLGGKNNGNGKDKGEHPEGVVPTASDESQLDDQVPF